MRRTTHSKKPSYAIRWACPAALAFAVFQIGCKGDLDDPLEGDGTVPPVGQPVGQAGQGAGSPPGEISTVSSDPSVGARSMSGGAGLEGGDRLGAFGMADPALSPGSNPGLAPVSTEPVIPTVPYEIQKGDSLSVIAQRYKTSIATLQKLNGLQGTFIRYGQTIRVPAPEGAATAAPPQPEATAPGIPAGFGTAAPAPTETSVPPPTSGTGVRGGDTGFGFGGSSTPRPRTPSADDDFLNLPAPQ